MRISVSDAQKLLTGTNNKKRLSSNNVIRRRKVTVPETNKNIVYKLKASIVSSGSHERRSVDSRKLANITELNFYELEGAVQQPPQVTNKQRFRALAPLCLNSAKNHNFFQKSEKGRASFSRAARPFSRRMNLNTTDLCVN